MNVWRKSTIVHQMLNVSIKWVTIHVYVMKGITVMVAFVQVYAIKIIYVTLYSQVFSNIFTRFFYFFIHNLFDTKYKYNKSSKKQTLKEIVFYI